VLYSLYFHQIRQQAVKLIAKCGTREHIAAITAGELTDAPVFNAVIACEVPLMSDLLAYIYVGDLSPAPTFTLNEFRRRNPLQE
jgi:hypothetical protein